MRRIRLDRALTGTAVALVLGCAAVQARDGGSEPAAFAASPAEVPASAANSGVPLPELVEFPPLTASDTATAAPAEAAPSPKDIATARPAEPAKPAAGPDFDILGAIPVPEPADVAPLTAKDIAAPAQAPTPVVTAKPAQPAAEPRLDVLGAIPVPESANVEPLTAKDLAESALSPFLSPADLPAAEKLQELVTGKLHRYFDRKGERTAVEAFYTTRQFAPLWIEAGALSARAKAAVRRIKNAHLDGLDPNDYALPSLESANLGPAQLAEAELKLTAAVLTYARHAQAGRVHPSRVSSNMEMAPPVPEPAEVLAKIAEAKDVARTLDEFNPPHDGFKALRAKLVETLQRGESPTVAIPGGPLLKPGAKDERVPLIRERLGVEGKSDDLHYDAALVEAVKRFQRGAGVSADGLIGSRTVDTFNQPRRERTAEILVSNMERWRWLPRNLGKAYVMVNVPDFTLKTVHNGATVFATRIVVGKPETPTPMFSDQLENIVVNPTWHVPPSIIYNEYLPALEQDPTVLARMGLVVEQNSDGSIAIRQPPGERNALGRLKFNFPNRFMVYLHDTPDKKLFAHERRAFSHGCMRVQNPDKFGEVLLSIAMPQERYTAARLASMYGTGEHSLRFKTLIPVHITYMNAYVDEAGKLVIREDLYGYDSRVRTALKGGELMAEAKPAAVPVQRRVRLGQRERPGYRLPGSAYNAPQQRGFFPFFGGWFQ